MKSLIGASFISFAMLTTISLGVGGTVVQKATTAVNAYKIAEYQERIYMIAASEFIDYAVTDEKVTLKDLKNEIEKQTWVNKIAEDNQTLIVNTQEDYTLEVKIEENGQVIVSDQNKTLQKASGVM